jgi:hypothetical protein
MLLVRRLFSSSLRPDLTLTVEKDDNSYRGRESLVKFAGIQYCQF